MSPEPEKPGSSTQSNSTEQSRATSRKSSTLQIVLSIFVLYHLAAVVVLPNGSSLLGRRIAWIFLPYANTFGLNSAWQFFAPGPSPSFQVEYEFETPEGTEPPNEPLRYPVPTWGSAWSDIFKRRLCSVQFIAINPERAQRWLAPYLCRQNPRAIAVTLRAVYSPIPHIERAGEYADFSDMAQRMDLPRQRYECAGAAAPSIIDVNQNDPAITAPADGAGLQVDPAAKADSGAEP